MPLFTVGESTDCDLVDYPVGLEMVGTFNTVVTRNSTGTVSVAELSSVDMRVIFLVSEIAAKDAQYKLVVAACDGSDRID